MRLLGQADLLVGTGGRPNAREGQDYIWVGKSDEYPTGWMPLTPAGEQAVAELQSKGEAARSRGDSICTTFENELADLKRRGYEYESASLKAAIANAGSLMQRWQTTWAAIQQDRYQEMGHYVYVEVDWQRGSGLTTAINAWFDLVNTALTAFNAGLPKEDAAGLVSAVAQAGKFLGLSGNGLLWIGAGVLAIMILRR